MSSIPSAHASPFSLTNYWTVLIATNSTVDITEQLAEPLTHDVLENELHFTFLLPRGRLTSPSIPLHREYLRREVLAPKCAMNHQPLIANYVLQGFLHVSGNTD